METTDVIICGCGPTGALLSGILGRLTVQNVVLEKEKQVVTDPRGIGLDDTGIRLLQELGLYDKVHTEIAQCLGWARFTSGKYGLMTKPFMRMNLSSGEGGSGHVGAIVHKQPVMEQYLRLAANGSPSSQLRLGSTVVGIEEDEDWIYVKYSEDDSTERTIRGKFLVGADGKTGYIRKHFLEPKGVLLQTLPGYEYQATWVAMNWQMDLPTPQTHPDFPLWKLDYTSQQVFDAFFPPDFRFLANPDRPSVCGTFGPRSDRLWRFEFLVGEGEDPEDMSTWENASKIVLPYLTHAGSQYGMSSLDDSVRYPADCINVLRSRPFTFAARSCNTWVEGRTLLCGDAAHVMPPFGGQGIASGFRDASGLAWRLALACRNENTGDYATLFRGWFLERKQHLDLALAVTVANGNLVTARSPLKIFLRDWLLWLVQLIPSWKHRLELGPRAAGMERYTYVDGMQFLPEFDGGKCLPQVYCRRVFHNTSRELPAVQFTDDILLNGARSSAFTRLLVVVDTIADAEEAWLELQKLELEHVSKGEIRAAAAVFLIHTPSLAVRDSSSSSSMPRDNVYRTATADEFASSDLCKNRPYPTGYDMDRIKKEVRGKKYVLVRPDRFIYAACSTGVDLMTACKRITTMFCAPSRPTESQRDQTAVDTHRSKYAGTRQFGASKL